MVENTESVAVLEEGGMEDAIHQHYVYRHRHANHRRQNPISAIDGGTSLRGWRNKPSAHISVPFDLQTLFQSIVLPKPETASGHPPVSSDSLVVHGVHVSAINKLAANQPEPQNLSYPYRSRTFL